MSIALMNLTEIQGLPGEEACCRLGELESQSRNSRCPLIPARPWVGRDKVKTSG